MSSTLWAPWRMAYIDRPRTTGCLLCDLARDDDDRTNLILCRGPRAYVLMNRFPYNNGHLMIVPYRHCAELDQVSADDSLEIMQEVQRATRILHQAFGAEGFNVGLNLGKAAGAGIAEHIHMHVVPRWVGDTNFMPVLADTRVMPDYLEATYAKLVPFFRTEKG
ncbi:MAG: HIT domain-containing protein [Planctomycetota bacterium]